MMICRCCWCCVAVDWGVGGKEGRGKNRFQKAMQKRNTHQYLPSSRFPIVARIIRAALVHSAKKLTDCWDGSRSPTLRSETVGSRCRAVANRRSERRVVGSIARMGPKLYVSLGFQHPEVVNFSPGSFHTLAPLAGRRECGSWGAVVKKKVGQKSRPARRTFWWRVSEWWLRLDFIQFSSVLGRPAKDIVVGLGEKGDSFVASILLPPAAEQWAVVWSYQQVEENVLPTRLRRLKIGKSWSASWSRRAAPLFCVWWRAPKCWIHNIKHNRIEFFPIFFSSLPNEATFWASLRCVSWSKIISASWPVFSSFLWARCCG